RVREAGKLRIVHDFSGKPVGVNGELLHLLLDRGYAPVLTVPILDEEGRAVNSENDDIVAALQLELRAEVVVQLLEAPGFLESSDDPDSVVGEIGRAELERREQQVEGRMKRKLLAIRKLLDAGAARVILADGRVEHPVRDALAGRGTLIH
ncbi:MAG: acetylglutamate kinase, partial [Acidobacteriota bacterium]|nr:acetylglutamate kinase [Acidobacteriota bacterium]